jgi:hypothetical protein
MSDLALTAVATQAQQTRDAIAISVMKQNAQAERSVANMLEQSVSEGEALARSATPPGVGTQVDISA